MYVTNAIWTDIANTGKSHNYTDQGLWNQLLDEAREEGVTLERRRLKSGIDAIYLRRARNRG